MKIKEFNTVILVLLHTGIASVRGISVSGIYCGDVCSATAGSPYTLSCVWSGILTGGIVWSKDGTAELTCNPGGTCIPTTTGYASGSYPNSTAAILAITSFNPATDSGVWECRDSGFPSVTCQLPSVATGTLQGACSKSGSDYNITCSGISSLGSPAVTLELKDGSTVLASTTTAGSVSSVQTNAAGKTYNCSVSGPAAACLSSAVETVACPVPTTDSPTVPPSTSVGTSGTTVFVGGTTVSPTNETVTIGIAVGCSIVGIAIIAIIIIYRVHKKQKRTQNALEKQNGHTLDGIQSLSGRNGGSDGRVGDNSEEVGDKSNQDGTNLRRL